MRQGKTVDRVAADAAASDAAADVTALPVRDEVNASRDRLRKTRRAVVVPLEDEGPRLVDRSRFFVAALLRMTAYH